jgi:hypothetical protein
MAGCGVEAEKSLIAVMEFMEMGLRVYLRRGGACGCRVGSHACQLDHDGARARFPDQQPCHFLFGHRA